MKSLSLGLSLFALAAAGPPASANEVLLRNQVITCIATTPNIVKMWVEDVGFALDLDHSSAHARIHVQTRNKPDVAYAVSGQADRIDKNLAPNSGGRAIAYGGVECTLLHRNITSVHDCHGNAAHRTCEVGVDFQGERHAYRVSLSIRPVASVQPVNLSR
jgi:hypothetical protein